MLDKLAQRGETLEEREQRRAERRAAKITATFGYTATDNPFNDPNLAETFTWKKKEEQTSSLDDGSGNGGANRKEKKKNKTKKNQDEIIAEIEKVRKRRRDYEEQKEEMERIRAEESRMKELEHYDEWAQKEEAFHLQQQKQRSAIRLVEGREKPIDVLAKNLLLFGLSDAEKKELDGAGAGTGAGAGGVKYREKYNAMNELEHLEAELEEPHVFLQALKLQELEELLIDVKAFQTLEREVGNTLTGKEHNHQGANTRNTILQYWDNLCLVVQAEVTKVKNDLKGAQDSEAQSHQTLLKEIQNMFIGQSKTALERMKEEVQYKIQKCIDAGGRPVLDESGTIIDMPYWKSVLDELRVYLAKMELSEIHSKMLVSQLEKLEKRKQELASMPYSEEEQKEEAEARAAEETYNAIIPKDVDTDFGNLEEELGLTDELDLGNASYAWQEKYLSRKPRYFNRVRTGYDWNKYNQTHYDHDNPPPKTVQGYKFNIFYPDLIDKTKTPTFVLEPTKSNEFCIIRFRAGPPYEDVAFKIINREWNRSRKHGYKCTFERGVLSLYFNFKTHWYRR